MRRRLFTILSTLSLLLCAATVALWVRSYRTGWYGSGSWQTPAPPAWQIVSRRTAGLFACPYAGGLWFVLQRGFDSPSFGPAHIDRLGRITWGYDPVASKNPGQTHYFFKPWSEQRHCGFLVRQIPSNGEREAQYFVAVVPFWLLVLLLTCLPVCFARRHWIIKRRLKAGSCPECGYDLRATPERCPECGAVPAAATRR
jgi:hypothetical protein